MREQRSSLYVYIYNTIIVMNISNEKKYEKDAIFVTVA